MELAGYITASDTIERMEQAVRSRLDEAMVLFDQQRTFWSIYTMGYVVECCLKLAFLRLAGLGSTDNANHYLKSIAGDWATAMGIQHKRKYLHDLVFWLELIIAERGFSHRTNPSEFLRELGIRVQQVARNWTPTMRYQPAVVLVEEARQVSEAVDWIVRHREVLWS